MSLKSSIYHPERSEGFLMLLKIARFFDSLRMTVIKQIPRLRCAPLGITGKGTLGMTNWLMLLQNIGY